MKFIDRLPVGASQKAETGRNVDKKKSGADLIPVGHSSKYMTLGSPTGSAQQN